VNASVAELLTGWGTITLAVGTVGTLAVALRQLELERRQRRADEARAARTAHRRQAEVVSAWYGGDERDHSLLELANGSDQPVYQVVVSLAFVQGAAPGRTEEWAALCGASFPYTRFLVALPPGRYNVQVPNGWGALTARPGAEVGFTDIHGTSWVRRATGALEELPANAIDAFGIPRPIDFIAPRPADGGAARISI
jgi:hypothetical protein